MKTILCMKWGTKYGAEYVNRLYAGIERNLDSEFQLICLTDDGRGVHEKVVIRDLPESGLDEDAMDAKKGGETWRKVALFMPGLLDFDGDVLYLDLDVVLTGSLEPFFENHAGEFCVIHDWLEKRRGKSGGNTSVVRFHTKNHNKIYEHYRENQDEVLAKWRIEQQYVTWAAREVCGAAHYWPENSVNSFKRQCRPIFPLNLVKTPNRPHPDCSVLVFHGYPTTGGGDRRVSGRAFQKLQAGRVVEGLLAGSGRGVG